MRHRHTCHTPVRDANTRQHREPERPRLCDGLAHAARRDVPVPHAAAGRHTVHPVQGHAALVMAFLGWHIACVPCLIPMENGALSLHYALPRAPVQGGLSTDRESLRELPEHVRFSVSFSPSPVHVHISRVLPYAAPTAHSSWLLCFVGH